MTNLIFMLVARIDEAHQEAVSIDGGCKASCRTAEVGYYESRNGKNPGAW